MPPSLPRRSVETQYPHPLYIFVFESQTNGGSGKKKRMGAIPSVPSRFSVLLSSCLLHASRGQAWIPRARTKQSLPSRFSQSLVCVFRTRQSLPSRSSQSLVCFFFKPRATRSHLCHVGSACSSILFAPRISRTNVAPSSKHEPVFTMSVESKCCVCFS